MKKGKQIIDPTIKNKFFWSTGIFNQLETVSKPIVDNKTKEVCKESTKKWILAH